MKYLKNSKKSEKIINIIEQAIDILATIDIPIQDKSERALEKWRCHF